MKVIDKFFTDANDWMFLLREKKMGDNIVDNAYANTASLRSLSAFPSSPTISCHLENIRRKVDQKSNEEVSPPNCEHNTK